MGSVAYNPPEGKDKKWKILPIGGLYATYHLLGEPETTIDPLLKKFEMKAFEQVEDDGDELHQSHVFEDLNEGCYSPISAKIIATIKLSAVDVGSCHSQSFPNRSS